MMDYTYDTKHRTVAIEPHPHGIRNVTDLERHVHYLETEAYTSILKAFIAQSDLLTWGKEGLMTELRKELNITDIEHGEILTKINSDELIKRIREQRKLSSHAKDYIKASAPACASVSMGNSMIRLKTPSSATLFTQKKMSRSQASLISIPVPSSMPPKFNEVPLTAEFAHGNVEHSMEMFNYKVQLPPTGGGRVLKGKHQLQKDFHRSDCVKLKKKSDIIQIRATDMVIHDVEKMLFSSGKPDPVDIERAKRTLREQEIAITEALGKVVDVLERGDAPNQMQSYGVSKNTPGGQEMKIHANYCKLIGNGRLNELGDSF
ncbi:protein EMSY-LIKE 3 isoform X2 [Cajanus cajan]|uniref:protein EMSY-LIKE 3 isoform X2 n=1 Tax=Cajanus cajan TaxID=3821 RepID=UPI00098D9893|nr:protein EMSY-LIKE 3 isoform X2 [Cajanus cajan]